MEIGAGLPHYFFSKVLSTFQILSKRSILQTNVFFVTPYFS